MKKEDHGCDKLTNEESFCMEYHRHASIFKGADFGVNWNDRPLLSSQLCRIGIINCERIPYI